MNKTVMSKTRTSERGQGKLPSSYKRLKGETHNVAVDREVEILDPIDKYITVMGTAVSPEDGSTKGVVVKFNANNLPPHVIEPNLLFSTSAAEVGAWLFQVGIGNLADEMSTREFGGRVRRKADGKKVVVIDRDGYHKFQDGGKEVAGYAYGGKYHPFGSRSARVVLVGSAAAAVEIKGTVKTWNRAFRKYLSKNPRMLVVVCVSLASAIIAAFGRDGMVIAIIGPTSTGKSTTERMSASMIGAKDHVIKWDATAIGMTELVAENRDKPSMVEDMQEADTIDDVCRLAMNIGSSPHARQLPVDVHRHHTRPR
jgi:hypothetical protein